MFKGVTRAISHAAKSVSSTARGLLNPQPQHTQSAGNAAAQEQMSCQAGPQFTLAGSRSTGPSLGGGGTISGGGGGSGKQIGLFGNDSFEMHDGVYRPCNDQTPDVSTIMV